jgi:ribonuclease BN (tRNA processing enzyme)
MDVLNQANCQKSAPNASIDDKPIPEINVFDALRCWNLPFPYIRLANVKLHFLGTTGYHPNKHRHTACLMLPELGVIFDAGTGMFRARDLIETETLDIFMSHVHLDHSIGLTFLYDVLHEKDVSRVTVHVAGEKIETIRNHLYSQLLFPVKPNYDIRAFDGNPIELADGSSITTIPLKHPGGCLGFRLDWPDRAIAYITDTTAHADADYVEAITGVDTLIHECYFPDGQEDRAALTGHSCLTPVAQVAAKANVNRLFLVHINPLDESEAPLDLDSIADVYSSASVAVDEMVIDV